MSVEDWLAFLRRTFEPPDRSADLAEQIVELLRREELTTQDEVATRLHRSTRVVRPKLAELRKAGVIAKDAKHAPFRVV